jgi:hypothetical protein
LSACIIDQNSAHYLRRYAEKLRSVLPFRFSLRCQPHIGFMHQSGSLQRVAGALLPQAMGCQPVKFPVHEGDQLVRGVLMTGGQLVE